MPVLNMRVRMHISKIHVKKSNTNISRNYYEKATNKSNREAITSGNEHVKHQVTRKEEEGTI